MASSDLYGAAIAFLAGDAGDIRATVNAEQAGLLTTGSVVASRLPFSKQNRQSNPKTLTVDVVLRDPPAARQIGLGWVERDLVFELNVCLRRKDIQSGANQVVTIQSVARALEVRYHGVSNLALTVSSPNGTQATFTRSTATVTSVDQESDSSELMRAIVRLVLTFTDAQASNT